MFALFSAAGNMSMQDTAPSRKSFQVKEPVEAFREFAEAEVERLRETNPEFDYELYRRALKLVATRLENLRQGSGQ